MTFRSLLVPASLFAVTLQAFGSDLTAENDVQPPAPVEFRITPRIDFKPVTTLNNALQDDLWARMRAGFQMTPMDNQLVKDHENWFVNRPDYLKRVTERARRYMYHIVDALEKRGMPTELALLPIVESAYNPTAYSPAHASGLWQFIPSTGKTYGLEQTWWYDGRRDVVAATDAAINYFTYLYSLFGDWDLVLASYNWGEGAVARAVQKNRDKGLPTDFMSLNMPAETRNYVPKLIALRNIVSNPEAYGVKLDPIPNRPYFVTVAPNRHIDTKLAAKLADMSVEDFTNLNPAYTKPVIASKDSRRILLPVDKADGFLSNLSSYDKPTLSWQAYGTRKGESLTDIAESHGISVQELKNYNKIPVKAKVATGQILLVPMSDERNSLTAAGEPRLSQPEPLQIARRTNLKPSLLAPMSDLTPARVAQLETVSPAQPKPEQANKAEKQVVVAKVVDVKKPAVVETKAEVKPAATLAPAVPAPVVVTKTEPVITQPTIVAKPVAVSVKPVVEESVPAALAQPAKQNEILVAENDTADLLPNAAPVSGSFTPVTLQLVDRVSTPAKPVISAQPQVIKHKVVAGDTLYNIAKRYNLTTAQLSQLNKLGGHGIKIGQELLIKSKEAPLAEPTKLAKAADGQVDGGRTGKEDIKKSRAKQAAEKSTLYTVKHGDTLYSIARRYKVTPVDLKKWNNNPGTLQPGDQVKVLLTKG
ncbi:LysM peptidoglycan-binding domain-containing protein [Leeia oryzae]|uniref:LysM peptidoglycan-binding domain-containing protein n=1 Tax=Leeia oryzae TaxID=356662 RepID=UPI00037C2AA9|nr:LysM peptidoglycan-binding domain-containing protein [Leeia oryzae]